jgi:hypothetical protein
MPTDRQIRQLQQRWITRHDFCQPDNGRIFDVGVTEAEKLPTMVIRVVGDMENRFAAKYDRTKRDNRAILRLIEWPRRIAHGG